MQDSTLSSCQILLLTCLWKAYCNYNNVRQCTRLMPHTTPSTLSFFWPTALLMLIQLHMVAWHMHQQCIIWLHCVFHWQSIPSHLIDILKSKNWHCHIVENWNSGIWQNNYFTFCRSFFSFMDNLMLSNLKFCSPVHPPFFALWTHFADYLTIGVASDNFINVNSRYPINIFIIQDLI